MADMKVGLVSDPVYLEHDTGLHPENGRRLKSVLAHIDRSDIKGRLTFLAPVPATEDELMLVHRRAHILHIRQVAEEGGGYLDADTVMSPASYEVARAAAGGAMCATGAVLKGEVSSAFALVRPPGHHALPDRAMGFCLFNNIAIATRWALEKGRLERIAVIDFDVHHGNGTQEIFYDNPQVLYVSTHQYPCYPGTGRMDETGSGEAVGANVNIPLPAGTGDDEYYRVYDEIVTPVVRRFRPELIMVSAGYDAHWADHLAMISLTVTGFAGIVRRIKQLAGDLCGGKVVLILEGGYHPVALAESVKATLDIMMGNGEIQDTMGRPKSGLAAPDITPVIRRVKEIHGLG
ncbi:MAG: histone deacetylase [Chloroflexota bacterium]